MNFRIPVATNCIASVFDDITFESNTLQMKIGDILILYTDGVTEAFNAQGKQFSETRLENTLQILQGDTAKEVTEKLERSNFPNPTCQCLT